MNPFWVFTKLTGLAFMTAVTASLLWKSFGPKPEDIISSAIHFRKGLAEFQEGFERLIFGSDKSSPEEVKEQKEKGRITIE
jgi:hypothetical protein